jgi:hypothetical protein
MCEGQGTFDYIWRTSLVTKSSQRNELWYILRSPRGSVKGLLHYATCLAILLQQALRKVEPDSTSCNACCNKIASEICGIPISTGY